MASTSFTDIALQAWPYFDEHELFLAALADDVNPASAVELVAEARRDSDEEFEAQIASEMAAEGAWLRHAENAGWEEALEDERREARGF